MEKKKKNIKSKNSKMKKQKKVKNPNKNIKAKSKDTKMKFKYKHPKLALALKIALIVFLILCVVGAGVVIGLIYGLWGEDFTIDISELILKENSVIVDSEGNILAELNGDESRKIITLEEMSPYLPKAYIAIEDERFRTHNGVDFKRTAAAILSFVTNGGKSTAGGGSTITQQVVKNVTKDDDATGIKGVIRKVKEWAKAYQIEEVMSKDQILELYLNLIYVGAGGNEKHGVEIAAEYYFNKTAKDLSIAQCAFIAGINHSPNRYNPYGTTDVTERIAKRTKVVLSQMKKFNYVTPEEYDAAVAEVDAGFVFENGVKTNVYSAHTDALIAQLIEQIMEEKQISKDAAEMYLQSSGLKIYSTQVSSIQTVMEEEVKKKKYLVESDTTKTKKNVEPIYAQAAMVVIEPTTGNVVGCVGQIGEKTTSRGQNRATQSTRGTGSSFKPLATLIPGIEEGIINPATIYYDWYTIFNKGTAQEYDPKNYNEYRGPKTIRSATTTSQNIPFIKIMAELGNKKCLEYLRKMGISTLDDKQDSGLAASIGGLYNGVSPLEMAGAYASIANNGTYIEPTFYTKVEDADGKIVLQPNQKTEKVCSADTAYMVKSLLKSVVSDPAGTATYCAIKGIDVAAKTGTTNTDYDRWLCGFTNYYAGACWFGFDQQEDVDYNGNPAGRIFEGVMEQIHKGLESSIFEPTENIITATVCTTSGRLATDKCTETYSEIFIKDHLPEACDAHQGQFTICVDSGKLINEFCPATSQQIKSTQYLVEKERLGIWVTPEAQNIGDVAPTEYCDIHKKPEEVVVIPQQPETPPVTEIPTEKPEDTTTQEKPEEKPTETPSVTDKPTEKPAETPENKPAETPEEKPNTGGTTDSEATTKPSTDTTGNEGSSTDNSQETDNAGNTGTTRNVSEE